ncbi:hypothetical protein PV328_002905 [Microctonus aethiopoides]|uniref:Uncharacterized protein n=1 Tax=Microctonus aethiopoides TaxID=144406 RepID=A0AA39KJY1_9HYME|nr:hypothetical protein PV328_002905 [Microctonus aethiopoides]
MKLFIIVICLLASINEIFMVSSYPKLLVVSYDAFRHDYFQRNFTPFMKHLKEEGTDVDYMINAFVTKTFPNHHTMATGFYVETHGVLENMILTADNKIIKLTPELFQYNKNILPIWTINEMANKERHSGSMMWPGGEFEYNGINATFADPLNISMTWQARADRVLSWFLDPNEPINFAILYIEEPDFHAHGLGTQHPRVNDVLMKLDNFTKYIHDKLKEKNLTDVNVIHLSDHGMVDVKIPQIINITNYINKSECTILETANTIFVNPHPGKEEIVYKKLHDAAINTSAFSVYRKNEIPERYHYSKTERMSSIFVIAKSEYAFQYLFKSFPYYEKTFNITINNQSLFGVHGYDNEDPKMHPMFFARGPAFKSNCKLEPFHNVDLYPLFCNILDIECAETNGTLNAFKKCLKSFPTNDVPYSEPMLIAVLVAMGIVGTISILATLYLRRKRQREEILYRRILDDARMEQLWDEHQDVEHMWH